VTPARAGAGNERARLEVAQATGAATLAGAQTTQAATQAGTVGMMATGSVALVVGIFLGIVIRAAR